MLAVRYDIYHHHVVLVARIIYIYIYTLSIVDTLLIYESLHILINIYRLIYCNLGIVHKGLIYASLSQSLSLSIYIYIYV